MGRESRRKRVRLTPTDIRRLWWARKLARFVAFWGLLLLGAMLGIAGTLLLANH